MASKERLDLLLAEKGLFKSRSQAKRAIMAGEILVNNKLIDKAGTRVSVDAEVKFKGERLPYVSRGGLKLEKALNVFDLVVEGKEAIDIGSSTGGFTDCLLQNGAAKVYAVDVGYGQLAWKLRQDKRVEVIERTNFRYLSPKKLPVEVGLIVTDVSFISLKLIIPPALKFLKKKSDIIALIKPQFEAGPDRVGKNGVVRKADIHRDVIEKLSLFFCSKNINLVNLDYSPITGASGKNIEFIIHLNNYPEDSFFNKYFEKWKKEVDKVVCRAHSKLGRS